MTNQPFFTRDRDAFIPTEIANGPWNPNSLHGRVIICLLALVIEQRHGSDDFVPARLTVEVVNHHATNGVAIGECFLYDQDGVIGTSTVAALAQRKPMVAVAPT